MGSDAEIFVNLFSRGIQSPWHENSGSWGDPWPQKYMMK
jgi:hypothetical protein